MILEGTSHVLGHSRQRTLKDVESCSMLLQKITEAGEGGRVLQELQEIGISIDYSHKLNTKKSNL